MAEGRALTTRCSVVDGSVSGLDGWLGMKLSTDEGLDDRQEPVRR